MSTIQCPVFSVDILPRALWSVIQKWKFRLNHLKSKSSHQGWTSWTHANDSTGVIIALAYRVVHVRSFACAQPWPNFFHIGFKYIFVAGRSPARADWTPESKNSRFGKNVDRQKRNVAKYRTGNFFKMWSFVGLFLINFCLFNRNCSLKFCR